MKLPVKLIWGFLAVAVALGLTWEFYPLPDATARLHNLGYKAPGVQCEDIALAPAETVNFRGTTVLKRVALVGKDCVLLTVVDGTHNRHAIHDPIFCFRGAGWEVEAQHDIPVTDGEARVVRLRRGATAAEAIYWFSDCDSKFASPMTFWWKTALRRLSLGKSGQEPVLVFLTSTGAAPLDWRGLVRAWPQLQAL